MEGEISKVLPGIIGKAIEEETHAGEGQANWRCVAVVEWLSRKDTGKVSESTVVYVTEGGEAARLLQDQYFHVARESAYTRVFEPPYGPQKC